MNSQEPRVVKIAAMIAFLTLALGSVLSQRTSFAGPLAQTAKNKNPLQPTDKNIALGLDHFDAHCASCHGPTGKADSEKGKAVHAADLTSDKVQSMSDGEIYYTIKDGIRLSGMPAFGDPTDSDVDTWKLVHFIRHLPKLTPAEEAEMQKLNPKSPDEIQEEKDEENFLNGGQGSATPTTKTHHH